MDINKIKKLIDLLKNSDVNEIEICEGEESVRINRGTPMPPTPVVQAVAAPAAMPTTESQPTPQNATQAKTSGHQVKSPMVGTFYQSSSPSSPPFVTVGQKVSSGQVIGIIEAMKMMNQIEADKAGIIEAIHIKDGEAVEFDQALVTIV